MKKPSYTLLFITVLALLISGCGTTATNEVSNQEVAHQLEADLETCNQAVSALESELAEKETAMVSLTAEVEELASTIESLSSSQSNTLIQKALEVVEMIANQDSQGLDTKVSPTRGVRFSPYPYVDTNTDIILYPGSTVLTMFSSSTVQTWGTYSGSGNPITSDFSTYFSDFVYDEDFQNPELIGINSLIGNGNMINNVEAVYTNDQYVKFHFTGFDPNVNGLDWRSLILVFDDDNPGWELMGIVHGEWTT